VNQGETFGMKYEAVSETGLIDVTQTYYYIYFDQTYSPTPVFLAKASTRNEVSNGNLRFLNYTGIQIRVMFEEDDMGSNDADPDDSLGYVVFEKPGLIELYKLD